MKLTLNPKNWSLHTQKIPTWEQGPGCRPEHCAGCYAQTCVDRGRLRPVDNRGLPYTGPTLVSTSGASCGIPDRDPREVA